MLNKKFCEGCPLAERGNLKRPCVKALNKIKQNDMRKLIIEKRRIIKKIRQYEGKDYFSEFTARELVCQLKEEIEETKFECGKYSFNCEWYINNLESNYCFWLYIAMEKNQKPHTLEEIAYLDSCTIQNIKSAEVFAFKRLKKEINGKGLDLFFNDRYGAIREKADEIIIGELI